MKNEKTATSTGLYSRILSEADWLNAPKCPTKTMKARRTRIKSKLFFVISCICYFSYKNNFLIEREDYRMFNIC